MPINPMWIPTRESPTKPKPESPVDSRVDVRRSKRVTKPVVRLNL